MNITNQPVYVVGGGSGLGAATVKLLSEQGGQVAVIDLNHENAIAVAKAYGGFAEEANVADEDALAAAFTSLKEKIGAPRAVINCAGIGPAEKILGRNGVASLALFEKVVSINLKGAFNCLRLACAHMQENDAAEDGERGVIINTASIAAYEGQIGQAAYAASKAGVIGLTLPAAREMARYGIRVMTIAPGLFATPLMETLPQEVQDSLAASVPFPHRLGRPEEFALTASHIISNPMLNGETIRLDGSLRMSSK